MTRPEDAHLIDAYRGWLLSWGAADKTISARTQLAARVLAEWGLDGFTPAHVQEFMGRPKKDGQALSRWSRATYYNNLKDFCGWLVACDHIAESPMDDPSIKTPRRPKKRPRPLTEIEVDLVLRHARGRTRDWIVLALNTGLRAHEVAKIRGQDVSLEGVHVQGKGDVSTMLPCHPDVWTMAQRYPRHGWWFPNRAGSGPVTPTVVTMGVHRLFDSLGIDGSIHRCRHVYGTRLLRQGTNIRKVQHLMRHASLETTALYTAVDEDELRDAVLMLPSTPIPDDAA